MLTKYINKVYYYFLSEKRRGQLERVIFFSAIGVFIFQSFIIAAVHCGIIPDSFYSRSGEIPNILSVIYTPFSIVLIYEFYLLIFHLKESMSMYIAKQYEVVTLILIRDIFDKLSLYPTESTADNTYVTQLLYYFGGLIVLMLFIFCFYRLRKNLSDDAKCEEKRVKFRSTYLSIKKALSLFLMVLFVFLFAHSMYNVFSGNVLSVAEVIGGIKKLNYSFFRYFFSALIFTEVLMLLFTFNMKTCFSKVVRNSGFIVSTILIKLSFIDGSRINLFLILLAVVFGVMMLAIHKLFIEKL